MARTDSMHQHRVDDLFVVTAASTGTSAALALPFLDATIVDISAFDDAVPSVARYDMLVVDVPFCHDLFSRAVRRASDVLRPGGRMLLTVGGSAWPDHHPDTVAALDALRWEGLTVVGGQLFAVLQPGPGARSGEVAGLLTTADQAARLAVEAAAAAAPATDAVLRELDARQASESALLQHLGKLTEELEEVRRQHQGLRLGQTVLRRSKSGRVVLRALGPLRPAARRLLRRR